MKDERQRQIAELEAKRDSELRQAHDVFSVQRWLWPFLSLVMTPLFLYSLFEFLARLREDWSALPSGWPGWSLLLADCILLIPPLGRTTFFGFMAAVSGITCWITWISPRPPLMICGAIPTWWDMRTRVQEKFRPALMLCVLSQRTRQRATNNAAGSDHMRGPGRTRCGYARDPIAIGRDFDLVPR